MGWRIRKSINLGLGFRINLSKSGIGYSWGFPGYRVTKMANGGNRATYSIPGTGISYVEQNGNRISRSNEPNLMYGEVEKFENILIDNKNNDPIIKKINRSALLNKLSNIFLILTLGVFYHPSFSLCLIFGLILKIIIYFTGRINLFYEFDNTGREMYSYIKEVLILLSNNKKLWQATTSTKVYNSKYNAGAKSNVDRNNAFVTNKLPWYIKTNIDIYGLNVRNQKVFFTPDRVIVFNTFGKVFGSTYNNMNLSIDSTSFVESAFTPRDSEIIDYTWRYVNRDGSRDLRFNNNKRYPVCRYGEFSIKSENGINTLIIYSNESISDELRKNLRAFGNEFNKLVYEKATENNKENLDKLIETKSNINLTGKNTKVKEEIIVENKIKYVLPDTSLLESDESKNIIDLVNSMKQSSDINICIGKKDDEYIIEKLKNMPNMLIGGTVMSGKTTYINSLLGTLLFTQTPNDLKLIIFDSKIIEYSDYKNLPHLYYPIITDVRRLEKALLNIQDEVESRLKFLQQSNQKSIDSYNKIKGNSQIPSILIIIDDLSTINSSDVLNSQIEDITSNGWKVNIYMIVTTNHPSSEILSTITRSNFPARLSFKVTSSVSSQMILSDSGAEKLKGIGTALYISRFFDKLQKVNVPFIEENDLHNLITYWSENYSVLYKKIEQPLKNSIYALNDEDPMFDDVVEFIISTRKASASLLQRRFRLGYNRSAHLIDMLEARGIIGPSKGSEPRDVLIDSYEEDK